MRRLDYRPSAAEVAAMAEPTPADLDRARRNYPRHQAVARWEQLPNAAPEREEARADGQ